MLLLVDRPERSTAIPWISTNARIPPWIANPSPTPSTLATATVAPKAPPRVAARLNSIRRPVGSAPEYNSKATLTAPDGEKATWEPCTDGKLGEVLQAWKITWGALQVIPPSNDATSSIAVRSLVAQMLPETSKSV